VSSVFCPRRSGTLPCPACCTSDSETASPSERKSQCRGIEVRASISGVEPDVTVNEQVRFLADDERTFVRVGSRTVSVHRLRPYESWEAFRPDIDAALKQLVESTGASTFQRIGLRYINRVEAPLDSVDLENYFGFRITLDEALPQELVAFIVGASFAFNEARDLCRMQLADAVAEEPGTTVFILDIDYWSNEPGIVHSVDAMNWVDSAHGRIEALFEGAISQPLRTFFGELEENETRA
jgi:uncharacterized protein (TIGR04255 family)